MIRLSAQSDPKQNFLMEVLWKSCDYVLLINWLKSLGLLWVNERFTKGANHTLYNVRSPALFLHYSLCHVVIKVWFPRRSLYPDTTALSINPQQAELLTLNMVIRLIFTYSSWVSSDISGTSIQARREAMRITQRFCSQALQHGQMQTDWYLPNTIYDNM